MTQKIQAVHTGFEVINTENIDKQKTGYYYTFV